MKGFDPTPREDNGQIFQAASELQIYLSMASRSDLGTEVIVVGGRPGNRSML